MFFTLKCFPLYLAKSDFHSEVELRKKTCCVQIRGMANVTVFFCLLSHTHINTVTAIAFEHLVGTVDTFVLSPLHSLLKSNFEVEQKTHRLKMTSTPAPILHTVFIFVFYPVLSLNVQ